MKKTSSVTKTRVIRKESVKYSLKIPRTGIACLLLFDALCYFGHGKIPLLKIRKCKKYYNLVFDCGPSVYNEISSEINGVSEDIARELEGQFVDVLKKNLHRLNGQSIEKKNSYGVYFCDHKELPEISKNILSFITFEHNRVY
jgi:hypothetical protein